MSRATQPPTSAPGTAMAERPAAPADFPALLNRAQEELQKLFVSPDMAQRFARVALTEFRSNGNINKMSAQSIMASVMQAAQLNLEVGGPMRQAYLVPYKGQCVLQVGYIGYIELARRSGQYRTIDAVLVYERDVFEFERDPQPRLYHRPNLFDPGEVLGVYVWAELVNGATKFEFLNRAEIEKIRSASPNKDGATWRDWYGEMMKAKALKRFLKKEALTPLMADALAIQEPGDVIDGELVERGTASPAGSRTDALAARLRPPGQSGRPALRDGREPEVEVAIAASGEDVYSTEGGAAN
jgi:recombination protein RecT